MEQTLYQNHLAILEEELQVAMGCTEPIAIAFAGQGPADAGPDARALPREMLRQHR